ncbi:MAG: S9 family peptidase, partial [Gammaproteobacteria bacterium]|nr:S9 family peptidase [Gammaproteobacteria bacterium]MYK29126.1 S9 family peptidase [Gammaproteobacteria bacterium]
MSVLRVQGFRRLLAGAGRTLPILILAEASLLAAEPADPYLWLEDIEGERALAWVAAQNRESEARLTTDPRFAAVEKDAYAVYAAIDRIPYARQAGQRMLNFWQDEAHVRGLLRSAERQAYLAGEPQWETLLDIDQLAETEGENWVYKGAECLEPDASRCLLMLSRGGGDAVVVREFDLDAKRFVTDGFVSSEAKQSVAWLDADRLLIAKAGDGFRVTDSGYGAELRLWRRGEPLQASQLLLDVPADHVAVSGAVLKNPLGTFPFAVDAPTFFEEDVYY